MQVNVNFHGNYNNKALWGTIFHAVKVSGYFTIQNNLKQHQTIFSVFDLKSAMKIRFCILKSDKHYSFIDKTSVIVIVFLSPPVTWTLYFQSTSLILLDGPSICHWTSILPQATALQHWKTAKRYLKFSFSFCLSLLVRKKMSSQATLELQMAPEYCLGDITPHSAVCQSSSSQEWFLLGDFSALFWN